MQGVQGQLDGPERPLIQPIPSVLLSGMSTSIPATTPNLSNASHDHSRHLSHTLDNSASAAAANHSVSTDFMTY